MGMQMVRRRNAVSGLSILVIMCCWGCSASDKAVRCDLEPEEIPAFLANICSWQGASVEITDLPTPLVMTETEQKEIIDALKKDTHRLQIDDRFIRGASFTIQFQICLFRGPAALRMGLDPFGFGIGEGDEYRFSNPSLARALEQILERNGVFESEYADSYREMLGCGTAGPLPDAVEAEKPEIASDAAVQCIESFVDGAGEGEIVARIERTGGAEIGLGPRGADNAALIKSLVEDSWPSQSDEKFVSVPGRKEALEITVTVGAEFCIMWLDETGFSFGKDGQYRFVNPSLARQIEKLFKAEGLFNSPDSADGRSIFASGAGTGRKYKRMLASAGGKQRPEGAIKETAAAAREKAKAWVQGHSLPQESPEERAEALGFRLLQDPSRRLKGYWLDLVAEGLADTGKPGVPYLIKGLQSPDAVVRKLSARGLARIGPEAKDAAEVLGKAMAAEKDSNTASEIASAIGKVGPPPAECIPAVLAALTKRGDFTVVNYCDAMVALGSPAVPALVAAMESPDRHVQYRAIEALGRIGPGAKGAIDALVKRMQDGNSYFNDVVDGALAGIGTPAIPAILDAAGTGDGSVRYHAAKAMGQMGSKAIPYLLTALKNDNPDLRAVAADALGQIEPPAGDAVPSLIALMKDMSDDVRYSACESLARIGDPRALGVMLEAAKDQESGMRCSAAEALGVFTPPTDEAIKTLLCLLLDKQDVVRHTAIIALGRIGPKACTAIPELERISKTDDDADTREMATDARRRIAAPDKRPSNR